MFNGAFLIGRYDLFESWHEMLVVQLLVSSVIVLTYFITKKQKEKHEG